MDAECAVCHRKNDQLLMLSCGHDPCIDCAATHYFTGAEFRRQFQLLREANYWCQICFQPTIIDKTSIQQLNYYLAKKYQQVNLMAQTLKRSSSQRPRNFSKNDRQSNNSPGQGYHRHTRQKKKTKESMTQLEKYAELASSHQIKNNIIKHSEYSNQVRSTLKGVKSSTQLLFQQKPQNPCLKHEDQVQSYYCFSCVRSICVQCALHGSHVGHQVQAVKKASAKLKIIYQNLISQSQKCKTILQNNSKQIQKIAQGFKSWNNKHYELIKQKFSQLFQVLAEKQTRILNQIKQIQNEGLNKLIMEKKKQEQMLIEIKNSRKNLKRGINIEPSLWNVEQLEVTKIELRKLITNFQVNSLNAKKIQSEIRYVDTQLVLQAIDTIQELVTSFKISTTHNFSKSIS